MPDISTGRAVAGGDLAFLVKKEFDGKLREDEGTLSATGDIATLTATAGKDMYLAEAKVNARTETNSANGTIIIELKINGVVKETYAVELNSLQATTGGAGSSVSTYAFAVKGIKVAATQIIKLEATVVDAGVEVSGSIVVFEENTGGNPLA